MVLGVGVVILLAAGVAGVALGQSGSTPAPGPSSSPGATIQLGSGGILGPAALPRFESTGGDPAVGRPAPAITATSFDGSQVSIAADGRPKLVLFLAHWCPHCQREVPVAQDWLDAGRLPDGVDLISVVTATDPNRPNYPPDAWLSREGWQPPVLVDSDDAVADLYGLTSFPYWVGIDSDGKVVRRAAGELTPDQLDTLAAAVAGSL